MEQQEDVVRTQEMSLREIELALAVAKQAVEPKREMRSLLIPNELKHLSLLDWEIVGNLLATLESEKEMSQVH